MSVHLRFGTLIGVRLTIKLRFKLLGLHQRHHSFTSNAVVLNCNKVYRWQHYLNIANYVIFTIILFNIGSCKFLIPYVGIEECGR